MNKTRICYWCGAESVSDDHVPPRSFFPKGKRIDLIKVSSCKRHNEGLSKLDEKFRLYLQMSADSRVALDEFKATTLRGLRREEATGFRKSLASSAAPMMLNGRKATSFEVKPEEMNTFSEKILRGLYFHHYDEVFQGVVNSVCTHIHSIGFDIRPTIEMFVEFRNDLEQGSTKNEDVFKYECGRVTEDGMTAFAMICTFYETVTIFGLGIPTEALEVEQGSGGNG
jgi:hypothetical protein